MLRRLISGLTSGGGAATRRRGAGRRGAGGRVGGRRGRQGSGSQGARLGSMVERFIRKR